MTVETAAEPVVISIPVGNQRTMSVMKSIRTDPDLWEAAKATAQFEGEALATAINDFLESYVLRSQKRREKATGQ